MVAFTVCIRDLAIIDMLYTTGMRISELISLNREDIDFVNRECRVVGKGDKERIVYFDAKTKLHLQEYLESREDDNEALFVQLLKPHGRMQVKELLGHEDISTTMHYALVNHKVCP